MAATAASMGWPLVVIYKTTMRPTEPEVHTLPRDLLRIGFQPQQHITEINTEACSFLLLLAMEPVDPESTLPSTPI